MGSGSKSFVCIAYLALYLTTEDRGILIYNTFVIQVLSQQQTYRNIHGKRTLDKLGMLFVVL